MRQLAAGAVFAGSAIALMALTGTAVAQASSSPDVVGQKYSDAQSAITGASLTPVISTVVGDRNAHADCLVVNQVSRTVPPPENSSGAAVSQVLVSLNCDDGAASATKPGFSAASPEGVAAKAADKAAADKAAADKTATPAA